MQINLPLNEMTKEEKLRIMETIWADLIKSDAEYPSPSWHQDVLNVREQRIKMGDEKYNDWELAKKEIRNRVQ